MENLINDGLDLSPSDESDSESDNGTDNPANTLRKSNVLLWLYFSNLRKLLSANVDVT